MTPPSVLLITGPGGSGKTTLAQAIAGRMGWTCLGEDEYWVANGWGHGLRTPAQEAEVQAQVTRDLLAAVGAGRHVVLEFILYQLPPNPLTAYDEVLTEHGVAHGTIVLKPSVEELLRRMASRGRPGDAVDVEHRRPDAEWQVGILESDHIDPDWIIDPTGAAIDDLVPECLARLAEQTRTPRP